MKIKHLKNAVRKSVILIIIGIAFMSGTTGSVFADATTGADMEIVSAPIHCWPINNDGIAFCTYIREIRNGGPADAIGVNIKDSFFPQSALFAGPFYEVSTYNTCETTFRSGCRQGIYFDVYLKGGMTISHVITVDAENDPNFSNNLFVDTFTILPDGSVVPATASNNYYNNHYNNGYNNGFNNGYLAPFEIKSNGFNNGYNNNYNNGYNNNYNNGYNNGYIKPVE